MAENINYWNLLWNSLTLFCILMCLQFLISVQMYIFSIINKSKPEEIQQLLKEKRIRSVLFQIMFILSLCVCYLLTRAGVL